MVCHHQCWVTVPNRPQACTCGFGYLWYNLRKDGGEIIMITLTAKEIQIQFEKIVQYFVYEKEIMEKYSELLNLIPDTEQVDIHAAKFEIETDQLIHKLAEMMNGDRKDTINLINTTNEDIVITLIVRILTINQYFTDNPNKTLPISEEVPQFFIDCLINYWRLYQQNDIINYLGS